MEMTCEWRSAGYSRHWRAAAV